MIKHFRSHNDMFRIKDSLLGRALLIGAFLLALMLSNPARAEQNPNQWIASLGGIAFNQSGASFIPMDVISSMQQGQTSPILQYVLINNLMNQAIGQSLSETPNIRDPYVVAKEKWDHGICTLTQTYKTMQVIVLLPQMNSNSQNGGSNDVGAQRAALQQAVALAQAVGASGCDGSNTGGIDSNILSFLNGLRI